YLCFVTMTRRTLRLRASGEGEGQGKGGPLASDTLSRHLAPMGGDNLGFLPIPPHVMLGMRGDGQKPPNWAWRHGEHEPHHKPHTQCGHHRWLFLSERQGTRGGRGASGGASPTPGVSHT